jgi:hypothetical protein
MTKAETSNRKDNLTMGYNINDVFPSKYLKAADLNGKTVTLTIKDVGVETIGDDDKLVVYFKGRDKGLVMNKTNSNNIALVFGPDTDGWLDQDISVFPTMVDFQGRSMEAIRVKANPRPATKRPVTKSQPRRDPDDPRTMAGHPNDDPSDDIPF